MNYTKLANIGIIGFFISGIFIIGLILTGNAHYSIPIETIFGAWSVMQENPVFDYSVMINFGCLLIFSVGKMGEENNG